MTQAAETGRQQIESPPSCHAGVNHGETKYISPNKAEGTHNIEYFLPTQDGDHDGSPDPGQTPVGTAQVHTVDTRLGQYVAP